MVFYFSRIMNSEFCEGKLTKPLVESGLSVWLQVAVILNQLQTDLKFTKKTGSPGVFGSITDTGACQEAYFLLLSYEIKSRYWVSCRCSDLQATFIQTLDAICGFLHCR